jgi:hypothetical protein
MNTQLLNPTLIPGVSDRLKELRFQQKKCYDRSAKPLFPLKEDDTVRIQSDKGYDKLGVVQSSSQLPPRSYNVEAEGIVYRRNRKHLLRVPENTPVNTNQSSSDPDDTPQSDIIHGSSVPPPVAPNIPSLDPPGIVTTRSGRHSRPNPKYDSEEYVRK